MSDVDLKVVEEKLAKNETLSAAELKAVMSAPPDGSSNKLAPEDDIPEEDYHEGDPNKEEKEAEAAAEKAAADKAKADKDAADKAKADKDGKVEQTDEYIARFNAQLAQPDGQEDFTNWTKAEIGYFRQMKSERKRAQKAEEERDTLKFNEIKRKKAEEAKAAQEKEEAEEAELFKDRNPDDPLTVKDLQAMMKLNKKKSPKDTDGASKTTFDINDPLVASSLKFQDEVARKELGDDYDETVECTDEIIANNPAYLKQIATALIKGENVAKLTYQLIKGDAGYQNALPAAKARLIAAGKKTSDNKKQEVAETEADAKKKADALAAQKKLEENQNKKKTSAHVTDAGAQADAFGDYTVDQLLKMTDREFHKVPKKVRDAFMKAQGV